MTSFVSAAGLITGREASITHRRDACGGGEVVGWVVGGGAAGSGMRVAETSRAE